MPAKKADLEEEKSSKGPDGYVKKKSLEMDAGYVYDETPEIKTETDIGRSDHEGLLLF